MSDVVIDAKFPIGALVPKSETGVLNFLQKYPQFDGKDVTIAIFDSGVDPRAAGLQTTLDGGVKVIERFDCSGCGDTDTSKKVKVNAEGYIVGVSGKKLMVTDFMKENNKDGNEYRVGLKSLYDLYPLKIREKVSADVKLKKWDGPHKKSVAEATRELNQFESKNPDLQSLMFKDKLKKEDLESTLELLNTYEKKYLEIRTTYDCVLFPTESGWYAVIDTSENGELETAVLIAEYSKTHEIKNVDDFLSISINVHDAGNVLEIVGICSSHGTHVASIAAGNHSICKDLDGVAPNAKIVSLTIGDGRLGSMETGTALARAMCKVMELCNKGTKIDVINMSYGEHAHWTHCGRVGELMNEVVNKYGIVWVAAAGNHGPALCTIGTPPDISQSNCIGVGAYVSPQMMEAEYALRGKIPANVYTWTSRDPCIDGGQGVTICAPGAAITSVPEFTMSGAQLMNGTSMAAPHVAGAIALIISGLKQKDVKYSPYGIKRAVWNTATKLEYVDAFAQGNGLLNVEKAFEHLVQYSNELENLVRFSIKVGNLGAKGIHLRQGVLKKKVEMVVAIQPIFFNEEQTPPKDKINFNIRLNLVCSESWIQCGSFLDLCYGERSIIVQVDPTNLHPGVHTARIRAYDSNCIQKGTVFEVPVTVVQPHVINTEKTRIFSSDDSNSSGAVEYKPNTITREFIMVPNNATSAVLKMISTDEKQNYCSGKFFIHTMQILPLFYCKHLETMKILSLNNERETVHAFSCKENNILELCIAKYWSDLGKLKVKYTLEFHGIVANTSSHVMLSASGIYRIDLIALGVEEITPSVQLKTATVALKPSESKISPLSDSRDVLPPGRQVYQNLLTYNLHLSKSWEVALYTPLFSTHLYESEYESQLWMLYDVNKMMVVAGDAYSSSTYIKLEKGEYVIKMQVRHEKKDLLEKISEATMLALFKLSTPLSLDIFAQYNEAVICGKKLTTSQLSHGVTKALFIAPLTSEKITKAGLPTFCSWLSGSLTYAKDENCKKYENCNFKYILSEGQPVKKANFGSVPKKNSTGSKNKLDEYKESLRDHKLSMLSKLDLDTAEEVYKEVLADHPDHLPAHLAFCQILDTENRFPFSFRKFIRSKLSPGGSNTVPTPPINTAGDSNEIGVGESNGEAPFDLTKFTNNLNRIVELANLVITNTDAEALLAYYGLKIDPRSDAAKFKTNMDKQKITLLDSYVRKGIALCRLSVINAAKSDSSSVQLNDIDAIYIEIGKFTDTTDPKLLHFSLWHAFMHMQYGRMSKYLHKLYEDKPNKEILVELQWVIASTKNVHLLDAVRKFTVSANPMTYRLF